MSFQPAIPVGGIAGWRFIQRVRPRLQQTYDKSADIQRSVQYFRDNIGKIDSAAELVSDRRLLAVALGAFGLDEDIDNRFFIRKILESNTFKPDSLANKLSDKRYRAFAKAFGFGNFSVPNTKLSDFPDKIITAYRQRGLEAAIGRSNADLRLAMGVQRDLDEILSRNTTEAGYWYAIMGTPPLRRVFETALGMPSSLGRIDLDRQLKAFSQKARAVFGSSDVKQFADPRKRERLIDLFLARSQATAAPTQTSSLSAASAILAAGGASTSLLG